MKTRGFLMFNNIYLIVQVAMLSVYIIYSESGYQFILRHVISSSAEPPLTLRRNLIYFRGLILP